MPIAFVGRKLQQKNHVSVKHVAMCLYILKGTVLEVINSSAQATDSILEDCCSVLYLESVVSAWSKCRRNWRILFKMSKQANSCNVLQKITEKVKSFYTWKGVLELEIKIMCLPQSSQEFKSFHISYTWYCCFVCVSLDLHFLPA